MPRSLYVCQLLCGILVSPAFTQDARVSILPRDIGRAKREANAQFRVDSHLVLVPVAVTDGLDRLVTGLARDNFKLLEDNVPQEISQFSMEDAPVSIALVFDASGSMEKKLDRSKAAVVEFVKASNPADEFTLIEVHDRPNVLVPFTVEAGEIQAHLPFLQPRGSTALLDAIYIALNEMKRARHARKAIFIISDGGDNASRYNDHEVIRRVREADVQIYSVGIFAPPQHRFATEEEAEGPRLLSDLARTTGGRLYEIATVDELGSVVTKIGSTLRNQYVLGYAPAAAKLDGKYHRITVKLQTAESAKKLRATFRTSYLAPMH